MTTKKIGLERYFQWKQKIMLSKRILYYEYEFFGLSSLKKDKFHCQALEWETGLDQGDSLDLHQKSHKDNRTDAENCFCGHPFNFYWLAFRIRLFFFFSLFSCVDLFSAWFRFNWWDPICSTFGIFLQAFKDGTDTKIKTRTHHFAWK